VACQPKSLGRQRRRLKRRNSYLQLTAALTSSRALQTEILGKPKTSLKAAEARYAAGDISLVEILPVRRDWPTVRDDVIRVWGLRTSTTANEPRSPERMLPGQSASERGRFQINAAFVTSRVERFGRLGVKVSMDRVRIVISSLLPALWVLAAAHCLADPVNGCSDGCCRTAFSASQGSRHAPLKDVRSFEQSARLLNRRLGMQIGWGGLPAPAAVSACGFGELEYPSAPLTVSTEALGLSKCWQFCWRTAAEPRAPSSVS
jgi:hypothetical protein